MWAVTVQREEKHGSASRKPVNVPSGPHIRPHIRLPTFVLSLMFHPSQPRPQPRAICRPCPNGSIVPPPVIGVTNTCRQEGYLLFVDKS